MTQKMLSYIPGWSDGELSKYALTNTGAAYMRVPIYRACVDRIASSMRQIPVYINDQDVEDAWPYPTPLNEILYQATISYLLHGAAYILLVRGQNFRRVQNLMVLNGSTIRVEYLGMNDQGQPIRRYVQTVNGSTHTFDDEDIIFIRAYHPADDVGPGVAPGYTALNPAQTLHYLTLFPAKFFEGGVVGKTFILMPPGTQQIETNRIQSMLNKTITGLKNAFGVEVFEGRGEIDIRTLTPAPKDLAMREVQQIAHEQVLQAFGIPEDVLGQSDANRATAETHHRGYWNDTIRPIAVMFEYALNAEAFPNGQRLKFAFQELPAFQADENERAGSLQTLVQAGVPLPVAADVLGYYFPDDVVLPDYPPTMMRPEPTPAPPQADSQPTRSMTADDIDKWRRKAVKRFKQGKGAACDFDSSVIDDHVHEYITAGLSSAKTIDDLEGVFIAARDWAVY